MIIDFHTHIFPEKVAEKAIPKLADVINIAPSTSGTADSLLDSMDRAGIHTSVILPAVTNVKQFDSIIRFAHAINERDYPKDRPRLFSIAGIHPDMPDYKEKLTLIHRMGFRGIKIHPDYQGVFFDDIRYMRILDKASELGLFTITHAGFDPYSPGKVHCTPERVRRVLDEAAPQKLILAHMGCNEFYDKSEELLVGQDLYMDTAYSLCHMDRQQLCRMIKNHGAHRILFGTDSPWTDQAESVSVLRSLPLKDEEREQILWKNGAELLGGTLSNNETAGD